MSTTYDDKYDAWFKSQLNKFGSWEWNDTGVDVVLVEHNDEVMINRITDFFATIDAPMLKKGNVIKLFESGYTTIESIIKLSEQTLVNVLGENGRKVYEGLRARLNNIQLHTLLGAHASDRGIGVRKMKKLHQAFGSDKLLECPTVEEIISRDGFEYKTAQKVVRCITKFNVFMSEIQDYVTFAAETANVGGVMEGQKVVFTGFRDKELAAKVEAEGGEMQSAVSGKTTILVSSEPDSNSGKMKKARDLGVRVMGVEEFKELLN